MITAWPTTSPVNVSATSTPLYYYTAYPSVGSNETGGGLLGMASTLIASGSSTSIIIGSVALGIVGIGAAIWAVKYFKNGGTIGGLINKVKSEKGKIAQFANALPISDANKAKLNSAIVDPSSLLPSETQAALAQAEAKIETLKAQAQTMNQNLIQALPPQLSSVVVAKQNELLSQVNIQMKEKQNAIMNLSLLPNKTSFEPVQQASTELTNIQTEAAPLITVTPQEVPTLESQSPAENQLPSVVQTAQLIIDQEDVEAVKKFLEQKKSENK
jgi:hypothetical protein